MKKGLWLWIASVALAGPAVCEPVTGNRTKAIDDHPTAYADPADETRALDQFVHAYADDGRFMGSVLVMQNGKVLLDKGYGMADITRKRPNTPETAYHIGSITKQFTAASVLLLQDRGKLKISDSVRIYLPDTPSSWDQITLFDLLTHTSGLGDDGDDFAGHWAEDVTPSQLLMAIRSEQLKFQPGSQFSYSNAGYAVLGMVIEKVSGQPYGDFLHNNLFKPLGMTATAYNPSPSEVQAQGYDGGVDGPVPTTNPLALSLGYAAGGIVSTTHDMALWQTKLLGGQVLSPTSLEQMTTSFKQNYGLGVEVINKDGHLDVKHNGNVPGFRTSEHYLPDEKLNVVVLGNLNTLGPIYLGYDLIKVAHGMPGRLPPKPYPVSPAVLAGYAGTYVVSPKVQFVVEYDNGRLAVKGSDYPKFVLYGNSDTAFYSKSLEYDVTLDFAKASGGKMLLILHNEGQADLVGTRDVK